MEDFKDLNINQSSTASLLASEDGGRNCGERMDRKTSYGDEEESKQVIEEKCNFPSTSLSYCDVKSSAVVKYTAVEPPVRYLQLSSNTNLNQPPSNWLRGTVKLHGKFGNWTHRNSHDKIFSSFHLANNFTDCVGKVDVISDAENIKKLLKIPYGKSHISMMVHRVGKTLLLDEFDIHNHLLRSSQKQWEWLKRFYYEHVSQPLQEKEHSMLRKKKSRGYLQNKNMLSKFLYYSLAGGAGEEEESNVVSNTSLDEEAKDLQRNIESPMQPFLLHTPTMPDLIKETEEQVERGSHEFLRNVEWTFEDIRMLIGSDMPIFGGGTYPAVSLRLRDMEKPINVLTGLDYWLDNLMCNVPEVVMCYHLNGIVQKYELIKTEDIPQLKNSQFSPKVVKDIAQNILSFLKSNATKSGHTYWLFKGKNDDVVKLYDLTTLCGDVTDEKEQNPFTLPVVMLLYRVACNMKESPEGTRKQGTIYRLLKNCLCLLDSRKNPQIAASVHYLLSEIYVPSGLDPTFVHGSCPSDESDSDDENDDYGIRDTHELNEDNTGDLVKGSSCVEVKELCVPNRSSDGYTDSEKAIPPLSKNWEERCSAAMDHIVEGLKFIQGVEENEKQKTKAKSNNTESKSSPLKVDDEEENPNVAKPFQPIPLHYMPINSPNKSDLSDTPDISEKSINHSDLPETERGSSFSPTVEPSWKLCCKILLLQKAAQTYCVLAEVASSAKRFGEALRFVKMGLLCYEHAPKLVASRSSKWPTEPLAYLLSLAGDVHFMLVQRDFTNKDEDIHRNSFETLNSLDTKVINILHKDFGQLDSLEYSWVWTWPEDLESSLKQSGLAYEMALKVWPDNLPEGLQRLKRRWGNICNELGVFYMNQAARLWNETGKTVDSIMEMWNKSLKNLENGIAAFDSVSDTANIALLNSNMGRLMRLCAHAYAPYNEDNSRKEFSAQERRYYNKAINYYSKAARVLGSPKDLPEIWDSVNWELSTTLFNMASLLQDYAPLSNHAQEEVEKEVSELMMKALKLCEADHPAQRIPLYQFRAASIHNRLGSLYHNTYRNQVNDDRHRKQLRILADLHYSKSCNLFRNLEHSNEFFRVLLERIGLWEHYLAGLTGFSSKLKAFYTIMEYMLLAKPVLQTLLKSIEAVCTESKDEIKSLAQEQQSCTTSEFSDDEEEKVAREKLLALFNQRLQFIVKGLVKQFSSKASRCSKELKQWNIIAAMLIATPTLPLDEHLHKILEQIEPLVPDKP